MNDVLANLYQRQFISEVLQEIVTLVLIRGHEPIGQGLNPLVHALPIEIRARVYPTESIIGVLRDDSRGRTCRALQVVENVLNYHSHRPCSCLTLFSSFVRG